MVLKEKYLQEKQALLFKSLQKRELYTGLRARNFQIQKIQEFQAVYPEKNKEIY